LKFPTRPPAAPHPLPLHRRVMTSRSSSPNAWSGCWTSSGRRRNA